jgi:hypothetical protein
MRLIFGTDEIPQERNGPGCRWLLTGIILGGISCGLLFHLLAGDCPKGEMYSTIIPCLVASFAPIITAVGIVFGAVLGFGVVWTAWAVWQYLMHR